MNLLVQYNGTKITIQHYDKVIYGGMYTYLGWRRPRWILYDEDKQTVATIRSLQKYFHIGYDAKYGIMYEKDNQSHDLTLVYTSYLSHFDLTYNDKQYQIIKHKGHNVSFFENDIQFAAMTKETINITSVEKYYVRVDSRADIRFLCTLIYGMLHMEEGNDGFTIDLGRIGRELKPFDKAWMPG